ncbi:hypothetical protein CFC21_044613, partial [Triticum aestivum]|jgi:hypothetical protein
LP